MKKIILFTLLFTFILGCKEPPRMWHESQLRYFARPCIRSFYSQIYDSFNFKEAVMHTDITIWNRYQQAIPYKGEMKMRIYIDTRMSDSPYEGYVLFEELPNKKMHIILKDWTLSDGKYGECTLPIGDEKPFGSIVSKD